MANKKYVVQWGGQTLHVSSTTDGSAESITWNRGPGTAPNGQWRGTWQMVGDYILLQDGRSSRRLMCSGRGFHWNGRTYQPDICDAGRFALTLSARGGASGNGHLVAPIAGRVTKIHVSVGDHVIAGQPLLILEAMKMENELRCPSSGVVREICVAVGQETEPRKLLLRIEPEAA